MTRQANYIRVALFVAAVMLPVLVWPRSMQPNTGQYSTESAKICLGNMLITKDKEAVLTDIEKVLSDKKKRPRTRKEVENLQERLKGVINSLSPSVQEQALPRVVPRRWEIQALWLLASENQPTDSDINTIHTLADEINLLRMNPPSDVAVDLIQELIKKEKELRDKSETLERALAIKQGKDALGDKDVHGIELAIRQLQGFEDGESKKLVYQLGLRREIVFAASDLDQLKIMETSKLKDYGLVKLSQGLIDLQLRVAINSNKYGVPGISSELIYLEKQVSELMENSFKNKRAKDVNKNREYQIWALKQLKLVKYFDDILQNELDKVLSVVDRNNPLSKSYRDAEERAFTALDNIMITYMAPINPLLLDEAVATWYRKVFKDRFDKLNDAHKLKVVEGFSAAEKRLIEQ